MTPYSVVFSPAAEQQLVELYRYIAIEASPATAAYYVDAIVSYCEGMNTFPLRGNSRDDIRTGLRITHYRGRTVIAFAVDDARRQVSILGVYYGGQDFETALSTDVEERRQLADADQAG